MTPGGALLVSDDLAGAVYRIDYTASTEVGSVLKDRSESKLPQKALLRKRKQTDFFTVTGKRVPPGALLAPSLLIEPVSGTMIVHVHVP